MLLATDEIGLFRANPNANPHNTLRLVHPETPGTTGTDTLAAYDGAAATDIQGINYTGKDGVSNYLTFYSVKNPTAEKLAKNIAADATAQELQDAIHLVISQHEVSPVVEVTKAGTVFTIVHVGAGTMSDLVVDGANQATVRT